MWKILKRQIYIVISTIYTTVCCSKVSVHGKMVL